MNGYNNFGYGYPGGYYGGGMYQEPQKINMTQGLTDEQLKSLRKTSGFNLDISQDELWRSFCTHRTANRFSVAQDDEGNMTCSLCGTKFKPFGGSVNDARDVVDAAINLMETTKMQCLSLPPKTIQDFFQIEPVLKRLPELYSQSLSDIKRVNGTDGGYYYGQENNQFNVYQNLINPMAGNGYFDPAMGQQPVYGAQPTYGMPQQGFPMNNGMPMMQPQQQMYGMPQQGFPMNNGMMPQQPQGNPFDSGSAPVQQPQQQNTNTPDQVTVSKTLTD